MNPRELRIGNWIYLPSKGKEYQISSGHDIEEIEGSDDATPIPLTPEWLERFGFYCPFVGGVYESITRSMDMRFRIHKVSGDLFIIGNYESSARPIQYVHQLQNLYFALTGEELELR